MKPRKPRPDFPLYAHASGQWAKRIRGHVRYFGKWDDPDAALQTYVQQRDDLYAGREPSNGEGLTVRQLVNSFLTSKQTLVDNGEIQQTTWQDYYDNCRRVLKVFGKNTLVTSLQPNDFRRLRAAFAKTHGLVTLTGDIKCTRVLFKYADDNHEIRVKYGQEFRTPTRAALRKYRSERAKRFFSANELRLILEAARGQLKAMIYLGLNCGFGNTDCALLPGSAIQDGWIIFPRPKTGILRRCPLWPESLEILPPLNGGRVFMTKYGNTWEPKSAKDDPIGKEFTKLLKSLELHRAGVGFYALRHTFLTIAKKTRDRDAIWAIMGWADDARDMSAVYNEEPVSNDRLLEVTEYVRRWLKNTQ